MWSISKVIEYAEMWLWGGSGVVAWLTQPIVNTYLPGIGEFFFTPLMLFTLSGLVGYLAVAIVKWLLI